MKLGSEIVRDLCLVALCAALVWSVVMLTLPAKQFLVDTDHLVKSADAGVASVEMTAAAVATVAQHAVPAMDNIAAATADVHAITTELAKPPEKKPTSAAGRIVRWFVR